ncbi:MAG: cytochrome b561 domain-containing protein [Pseudomonadota bacterium]
MEWLFAPIDPSRAHLVGFDVAWHGRSMVLAWGIIAPLAVLVARFCKVLPGQDWPRELDSQTWWRSHWIGQCVVLGLTLLGLALVLRDSDTLNLHARLGYTVVVLALAQGLFGFFRGSKGGPTATGKDGSERGDHYDMTPWRVMFEWVHKLIGYGLLALAVTTIVVGMWQANAPVWMWITILGWWAGLVAAFTFLQSRGYAIDTYQAIWGPGLEHPGNHRKPIGWGIRRRTDTRHPGE